MCKKTLTAEEWGSLGAIIETPDVTRGLGLSCDRQTQRLAQQGKIPGAFKAGHTWKFSKAKVMEFAGLTEAAQECTTDQGGIAAAGIEG